MGKAKEILMDKSEAEKDKAVAQAIGLTEEEMSELSGEYDITEEKDYYLIQFYDHCPKEILSKIDGLEDGNWIKVGLHIFDSPDDSPR